MDAWIIGLIAYEIGTFLVVLGWWLAHKEKMSTVTEAQSLWGNSEKFIPFLYHGGMWGDGFLMNPWTMIVVALYLSEWTALHIFVALIIGHVSSAIAHWTYLGIKHKEPHVQNGKLMPPGWVHFEYMALEIAVVVLVYFFTPDISHRAVILSTALLITHMFLGLHIPLGLLAKKFNWAWCPIKPWDKGALLQFGVITFFLIWRSWVLITR
jgi:hypothetical protein